VNLPKFNHFPAGGNLEGCFQLFGLYHIAAVNILEQVFLWTYVLISLGVYSGSEIAGSQVTCSINFIRSCQTVF
jgi:hypothetical protein